MNSSLPLEIWQTIFTFCDERTLRTMNEYFPHLIDSKHPTWRRECWRLRHDYAIPDTIFAPENSGNVNLVQILLQKPFTDNLINSAKMFTENIIALHTNYSLVPYRTHDPSTHGIIAYRFPLAALGISEELLIGSFRLSFDYDISTQLDRFLHLEMKTIVSVIDDGLFYGDEKEEYVDVQKALLRFKQFSKRSFTTNYYSASHAKTPVEDQHLSIRLQIPYGIAITNIRLNFESSLGSSLSDKSPVISTSD